MKIQLKIVYTLRRHNIQTYDGKKFAYFRYLHSNTCYLRSAGLSNKLIRSLIRLFCGVAVFDFDQEGEGIPDKPVFFELTLGRWRAGIDGSELCD